jgi:hypothetical protein
MRVVDDVLRYAREFALEAIPQHDDASKAAVKSTSSIYNELAKLAWDLITDSLPKIALDYEAIAKAYEIARRYLVSAVTAESMEGPDIDEVGYRDDFRYVDYEECSDLWHFQAAARSAADSDYVWLNEHQKTDVVGPVPRQFFEQPLWPGGEPSSWQEVLERHQRVVTTLAETILERGITRHLSPKVRPGDAHQWSEDKNLRRCDLIDRDIQGLITMTEKLELQRLQDQFYEYLDIVAPTPLDGARRLHQELLKKKQDQESQN